MLTVIGEALIDEVSRSGSAAVPHVGGSPLNVAVGLARLDHPVQLLTRTGKDAYGALISEKMRQCGVLLPLTPDGLPTSVARAVLDHSGAATYEFDLDWELPANNLDFMLTNSTLVHTGSIATMLQPGAAQVRRLIETARPHATISFDPNCRPSIIPDVEYAREQAEKFVRLADVVKASDQDLAWLYPGVDPLDSARRWLTLAGQGDASGSTAAGSAAGTNTRVTAQAGPAVVVVTRGDDGPWAVCADGESAARVDATQVVDTVGAGDSFMAALLSVLVDQELDGAARREQLHSLNVEQCQQALHYAARAAAVTVSRAGANPPSRAEIRRHP